MCGHLRTVDVLVEHLGVHSPPCYTTTNNSAVLVCGALILVFCELYEHTARCEDLFRNVQALCMYLVRV